MKTAINAPRRVLQLVAFVICTALTTLAWGLDLPSSFSYMGSVANTRHNMRLSTAVNLTNPVAGIDGHNAPRNDYQEVCVYCHTPHGSSTAVVAPLWNRTTRATSYTVYNSASLTQTASQPGAASLTCLSCHDGQTAMDSIINMPTSTQNGQYAGRYLASQQTTQNYNFLNSWDNPGSGYVKWTPSIPCCQPDAGSHAGMNSLGHATGYMSGNGTGSDGIGCLSCHAETGSNLQMAGSVHDMRVAFVGTDLSNDHPIGVTYPAANGNGTDWNTPAAAGTIRYFESAGGTAGLDKSDVRLYGSMVECASCHDPHGVPSGGPGTNTLLRPAFLRVSNAGSAVCLACHNK